MAWCKNVVIYYFGKEWVQMFYDIHVKSLRPILHQFRDCFGVWNLRFRVIPVQKEVLAGHQCLFVLTCDYIKTSYHQVFVANVWFPVDRCRFQDVVLFDFDLCFGIASISPENTSRCVRSSVLLLLCYCTSLCLCADAKLVLRSIGGCRTLLQSPTLASF